MGAFTFRFDFTVKYQRFQLDDRASHGNKMGERNSVNGFQIFTACTMYSPSLASAQIMEGTIIQRKLSTLAFAVGTGADKGVNLGAVNREPEELITIF
jgi:hypothetical protein